MGKKTKRIHFAGGGVVRLLVIAALLGAAAVLAVGLICSALTLRGTLSAAGLERGAQIALFLGALVASLAICLRRKRLPLVWGLGVGAAFALICLLAGVCSGGVWSAGTAVCRLIAALLGGVGGGVLSALRKK
ncbi:MAG: hypothetical protein IJ751_03540 [Oscillospiraceae bacterium]|nr:hypothetical protein [Oscillospiraceae bacterium]